MTRIMADERETGIEVSRPRDGESVFDYVRRCGTSSGRASARQLIGAANEFKHGDAAIGVASRDDDSRRHARRLLAATRVDELWAAPLFVDAVAEVGWSALDPSARDRVGGRTLGQLARFALNADPADVAAAARGWSSDAIGCLVKLMSNDDLVALGRRLFHALPGSRVGAQGYLGARIQPNSPTDHPDDIRWQVFSGFAYAVGDVVLGTNPVDSTPESVARVAATLHDVVVTFGLTDVLPTCVLAHIDVQAEVERRQPGTTGVWFQSVAGTESANRTFDLSVDKMMRHASSRTGRYGLYLETGQGADFTNGHGHGFDMVLHESRKYGFARALQRRLGEVQVEGDGPWLHVNDVAGFIGPEVFETREQLVRTCLEDIAMGKLHGLTIGLDICSTLHMKVSLDDLGWCIDQILPANPAYLMALPTRNDPMLSYLTTSFQDHVRIREQFGYRVDDRMWAFFQRLGVIDADGRPTAHFGDPIHVYEQFQRAKGDGRASEEVRAEGTRQVAEVEGRGVPIASGFGTAPWELRPDLDARIRSLYLDAKECVHAELTQEFIDGLPGVLELTTCAVDRRDYLARPPLGEALSEASLAALAQVRQDFAAAPPDAVMVLSDGLNPHALMDAGHLAPFLEELDAALADDGLTLAAQRLLFRQGRVRVGYRCGETLFGTPGDAQRRAVIHVIGERPGSGHHNFSVYLVAAPAQVWREPGGVDHDRARVVSGISDTALDPRLAARQVVRLLRELREANRDVDAR